MNKIFYFIFFITFLINKINAVCDLGYTYYNSYCYKYHPETTISLADAIKLCNDDYGELPVIHDKETNDFIQTVVADSVWLYLTCSSEIDCIWGDQSSFDFNNFQKGVAQTFIGNAVKYLIRSDLPNLDGLWVSTSSTNTNATTLCRKETKTVLQDCPVNYNYISANNDNCYKLSNNIKTFADAITDCQKDGGNLASIHSLEENLDIINFAQDKIDKNSAWIGLKININGNSVWIDNTLFDFNNYKKDFPNVIFGEAVEILFMQDNETLGYWENTIGTNTLPYICKMTEDEVANLKHSSTSTTTPVPTITLSPANKCPSSSIYEENHQINSPGFPSFYGNSLDCYYYLIGKNGSLVEFIMIDFNLSINDTLDIYDGNNFNDIIKSLSGADNNVVPGMTFTTTKNYFMVLRFRSSSSHNLLNYSGFNGYFTTTISTQTTTSPLTTTTVYVDSTPYNECPSNSFTQPSAIITSPGYPNSYGANLICTYVIEAPVGKKVAIQFEKIQISQSDVTLEIYDGIGTTINKLKQITKNDSGTTVLEISTSNYITLIFYTSGNPGNTGDLWYFYYRFT